MPNQICKNVCFYCFFFSLRNRKINKLKQKIYNIQFGITIETKLLIIFFVLFLFFISNSIYIQSQRSFNKVCVNEEKRHCISQSATFVSKPIISINLLLLFPFRQLQTRVKISSVSILRQLFQGYKEDTFFLFTQSNCPHGY